MRLLVVLLFATCFQSVNGQFSAFPNWQYEVLLSNRSVGQSYVMHSPSPEDGYPVFEWVSDSLLLEMWYNPNRQSFWDSTYHRWNGLHLQPAPRTNDLKRYAQYWSTQHAVGDTILTESFQRRAHDTVRLTTTKKWQEVVDGRKYTFRRTFNDYGGQMQHNEFLHKELDLGFGKVCWTNTTNTNKELIQKETESWVRHGADSGWSVDQLTLEHQLKPMWEKYPERDGLTDIHLRLVLRGADEQIQSHWWVSFYHTEQWQLDYLQSNVVRPFAPKASKNEAQSIPIGELLPFVWPMLEGRANEMTLMLHLWEVEQEIKGWSQRRPAEDSLLKISLSGPELCTTVLALRKARRLKGDFDLGLNRLSFFQRRLTSTVAFPNQSLLQPWTHSSQKKWFGEGYWSRYRRYAGKEGDSLLLHAQSHNYRPSLQWSQALDTLYPFRKEVVFRTDTQYHDSVTFTVQRAYWWEGQWVKKAPQTHQLTYRKGQLRKEIAETQFSKVAMKKVAPGRSYQSPLIRRTIHYSKDGSIRRVTIKHLELNRRWPVRSKIVVRPKS